MSDRETFENEKILRTMRGGESDLVITTRTLPPRPDRYDEEGKLIKPPAQDSVRMWEFFDVGGSESTVFKAWGSHSTLSTATGWAKSRGFKLEEGNR